MRGVATVAVGACGDPAEVLRADPHGLKNQASGRYVSHLPVDADEVVLPHAALREDIPDHRAVVLGVDSAVDILAAVVELEADTADDVLRLERLRLCPPQA